MNRKMKRKLERISTSNNKKGNGAFGKVHAYKSKNLDLRIVPRSKLKEKQEDEKST